MDRSSQSKAAMITSCVELMNFSTASFKERDAAGYANKKEARYKYN